MQVLRVLPNPWAATDKEGDPCGVCPREPGADGGGPGQFVGARLDSKHTKILQDFGKSAKFGDHARHEIRSPLQRTKYSYLGVSSTDPKLAEQLATKEAIELPVTNYYKERLREGALVATDADTAKRAGLPRFVPPADFFKAHRRPEAPAASPAEVAAPAPEVVTSADLPTSTESPEPSVTTPHTSARKRGLKPENEA